MSPAAEEYRALYEQLQSLWNAGKGESDEADALRDRMDAPWYDMTEEECGVYRTPAPQS